MRDNIAAGNDFVVFNGRKRHVISYLQDFLFSPERCRTPVGVLSGGEKNRLMLARLFTKPANVLVPEQTRKVEQCSVDRSFAMTVVMATYTILQSGESASAKERVH